MDTFNGFFIQKNEPKLEYDTPQTVSISSEELPEYLTYDYEEDKAEPMQTGPAGAPPIPNFGRADRFAIGPKCKKSFIEFESNFRPGHIYRFTKKIALSNGDHVYVCMDCRNRRQKGANCPYTLRRVLVRNGYFITDPDEPVLPHFCVGKLELPTIPKSKVQSHFFKTAQKQKKSKPKPKPKVVLTDPIVASDQADPHPTMFDVSLSLPNPKPTSSSPKPNPGAVKDFGPGRFKEIKKNIYLVYESAKFDSHEFKFKKCGSLANGTSIFECAKCRILKLRNKLPQTPPTIRLLNNRILDNPDAPKSKHFCMQKSDPAPIPNPELGAYAAKVNGVPEAQSGGVEMPSPLAPMPVPALPTPTKQASYQTVEFVAAEFGPANIEMREDGKKVIYHHSKEHGLTFCFVQTRVSDSRCLVASQYFKCENCRIMVRVKKLPFDPMEVKVKENYLLNDLEKVEHACTMYTDKEIEECKKPAKLSKPGPSASSSKPKQLIKKPTSGEKSTSKPTSKPKSEKSNADFVYRIDIRGFEESEIEVSTENSYLLISAEHKVNNSGEEITRTLSCKKAIPDDIDKVSIEGTYENDCLVITGKKSTPSAEKRKVPIVHKIST